MKYQYMGLDKRAGYRTGKIYDIVISTAIPWDNAVEGIYGENQITVYRNPSFFKFWQNDGFIPYSSIVDLQRNWRAV